MQTPAKIMIVDDEESVRDILARRLSLQPYRCVRAATAEEALHLLAQGEPDLILLDIRMPGMTGLQLLRRLQDRNVRATVLMITAVADTDRAVEAMKLGAADYILKPFDLNEVVARVQEALQKHRATLQQEAQHQRLAQRLHRQTELLRTHLNGYTESVMRAVEAKHPYTRGHGERVARLAGAIAEAMALPQEEVERVTLAALLHDIGKIGVREAVLLKPHSLDQEEIAHIRSHSLVAEYILDSYLADKEVIHIIRAHHERFDGKGYPDRLAGNQIPLGARIVAVADTYDALLSERPYRLARTAEEAREELLRCSGSQFDPEVVRIFLTHVPPKL